MFYELVDIPQHMSMYGVIRWSFEPHCSLFDRRNELARFPRHQKSRDIFFF
ncbi:hypothetical protein HBH64_090680 [Parastagonospora nodorum]|nr:hypothetical protein HBH42_118490 [Parastagonospora nodorum]KAH4288121.1 hypothetical protein HBI01_223640 [Parastagonospora nodorum]KAH4305016.1 hypothetical protein HBI02_122620 [Parastagonospora nodorum]KAH4323700.1 hypothetical protein HBI00_177390 [Parastagonospora nodorum]KAH4367624.1 hypothetical protein HBH94_135580 [Parastagonospora nodorum]